MGELRTLPRGLRGLIGGMEFDPELLDRALRHPVNHAPDDPPFCPTSHSGRHELSADAYGFCAKASPAGGVALCLHCARPIFVPPETCLERIDLGDQAELVTIAVRGAA